MFHPKHVLIKDEFQTHRMDHQSDILLRAATKFRLLSLLLSLLLLLVAAAAVVVVVVVVVSTFVAPVRFCIVYVPNGSKDRSADSKVISDFERKTKHLTV